MNSKSKKILAMLSHLYPEAHCALRYRNPLELLIATVLSAQCTDKRVNIVTVALFKRYKTAKAYAQSPAGELEALIRSTGFYNSKAKNIRAACRDIWQQHGGRVPDSMVALTKLAGVGRKTANVILGNAYGREEGICVDTHVGRLARRLGLTRHQDPVKVEVDLMALLPRRDWTMLSHWLIAHGREVCFARKPRCQACALRKLCDYYVA